MKRIAGAVAALLIATAAVHAEDAATPKAPEAGAAATAAPPATAPNDARQKRFAACRDDLKSLCADVEKGGGRKVKCLKDNEAKLQPSCKAVLAEIEKDRAERKAAGGNAAAPAAPAAAK